MHPDIFCISKCGAACCSIDIPGEGVVRCPNLRDDGVCSVYQQRFNGPVGKEALVVVGQYTSKRMKNLDGTPASLPFLCTRIEDALKKGTVAEGVKKGCCYHDKDLLNIENEAD